MKVTNLDNISAALLPLADGRKVTAVVESIISESDTVIVRKGDVLFSLRLDEFATVAVNHSATIDLDTAEFTIGELSAESVSTKTEAPAGKGRSCSARPTNINVTD
jgi:hypothetical protein